MFLLLPDMIRLKEKLPHFSQFINIETKPIVTRLFPPHCVTFNNSEFNGLIGLIIF